MRQKEYPAKVRARAIAWYYANKERRMAYLKLWRNQNPDKVDAYGQKWREAHRQHIYLRTKNWRSRNPDRRNTHQINRRARVANAAGSHTTEEWLNLKERCDYRCQDCSRREPEIKLTRDHIIPVSKGGSNFIANIQPLCGPCNSSKNDRLILGVIGDRVG